MRSLIVLALFATLTLGFHINDEEEISLRRIHGDCLQQYYIPSHFLTHRHEYHRIPKLKEHLACLAQNYGFMSETGHFDTSIIYNKLSNACDSEDAELIMNKCAIELDDIFETAAKFWYCLEDEGLPYMSRFIDYYQ
ncbi:unnamed protein product [Phyllotreta striolata]|uniref:Uncharacterized protein n=1 Tax=Phyllotreta striolata TaxID=444603 RepID=A0A9N9TRM1_PHYSR|nr:unnamed protein product [Phyllotreta striolata]